MENFNNNGHRLPESSALLDNGGAALPDAQNVQDFLTAGRHSATHGTIRREFPDFDLSKVPGVSGAALVIWQQRKELEAKNYEGTLDDAVAEKLRQEESPDAALALEWLEVKVAVYKQSDGLDQARRQVKQWKRDLSGIPEPSLRNERGALEYEPRQLVELLRPDWMCAALSTHGAHSERIREHLGDGLRFSPQLGWLLFDGQQWQRDDRHATQTSDRVKILSQIVRDEAAELYTLTGELAKDGRSSDAEAMSKAAASHTRHAKQVETKNFVEGALHFAAGNPALRVSPDAFDQRPWLLGFKNGVWDSGQWREHRREDLLLNVCPVVYDPNADRRQWEAVLDRMTGGDADFARTLQDAAGYILSGASHLRYLPWLYGPKGTGKSTYAELLQTTLGHMATTVDPKKLHGSAARERLGADIWNRRLAVCAEAGNEEISAELLKTLSGADTLTVRFLFQETFSAQPRHVLLMVSNDAPRLNAYDDALKDRVVALPFVHALDARGPLDLDGHTRIEAARKDPASNLVRGFVAWAVEGLARVHQTESIHRARCIEAATAQFWADADELTAFWETITEDDLCAGIKVSDLRNSYENWCSAEKTHPFSRQKWTDACKSRGLEQEKRGPANNRVRVWFLSRKYKSGQSGQENGLFLIGYSNSLESRAGLLKNTPKSVHSVHNGKNGANLGEEEDGFEA